MVRSFPFNGTLKVWERPVAGFASLSTVSPAASCEVNA